MSNILTTKQNRKKCMIQNAFKIKLAFRSVIKSGVFNLKQQESVVT